MQKRTKKIINNLNIEEVLNYYNNHSNKTTANEFNISVYILKSILKQNGVKIHTRNENMIFDNSMGKNSGTQWLYDSINDTYRMIKDDEVNKYLSEGWIKRSPNYGKQSSIKGRICITDGKNRIYIYPDELSIKLNEGFIKSVPHYKFSDEAKESYKNNLYEHYGVINVFQLNSVKEKMKKTCLEKYGVEYSGQAEIKKLKTKETFLQKTREELDLIAAKQRKTKLEKYGDENYNNRDKARATCLEKYNYISAPQKKTYYFKDGTYFDSSWELALWIYAKDMNLDIKYEPVRLEYFVDYKKHYYIPDFLFNNELIDIKGSHLVDENLNLINPWDNGKILKEKTLCQRSNNVKLWFWEDIEPYVSYVFDIYGENYLKSFRKKEIHND